MGRACQHSAQMRAVFVVIVLLVWHVNTCDARAFYVDATAPVDGSGGLGDPLRDSSSIIAALEAESVPASVHVDNSMILAGRVRATTDIYLTGGGHAVFMGGGISVSHDDLVVEELTLTASNLIGSPLFYCEAGSLEVTNVTITQVSTTGSWGGFIGGEAADVRLTNVVMHGGALHAVYGAFVATSGGTLFLQNIVLNDVVAAVGGVIFSVDTAISAVNVEVGSITVEEGGFAFLGSTSSNVDVEWTLTNVTANGLLVVDGGLVTEKTIASAALCRGSIQNSVFLPYERDNYCAFACNEGFELLDGSCVAHEVLCESPPAHSVVTTNVDGTCEFVCGEGYYWWNGVCEACGEACGVGTIEVSGCVHDGDRVCMACGTPPVSGASWNGVAACTWECDGGTWFDGGGCAACGVCEAGEVEVLGCNAVRDTVCVACYGGVEVSGRTWTSGGSCEFTCEAGQYGVAGTGECVACTTVCALGLELTGTCSGTTDARCEVCGVPEGAVVQAGGCDWQCPAHTALSDDGTTCEVCGVPSGAVVTGDCTWACPAQTVWNDVTEACDECTVCGGGEYAASVCDGSVDTVCEMCTVCDGSETEIAACGETQDTICVVLDTYAEVASVNASLASVDASLASVDQVFADVWACLAGCGVGSYISGGCNESVAARECATCTQCADAGEVVDTPCGERNDASCVPCYNDDHYREYTVGCEFTCPDGQYNNGFQCLPCSVSCPDNTFVSSICGPFSDRTCTACDAGEFTVDPAIGDTCQPCPALMHGSYIPYNETSVACNVVCDADAEEYTKQDGRMGCAVDCIGAVHQYSTPQDFGDGLFLGCKGQLQVKLWGGGGSGNEDAAFDGGSGGFVDGTFNVRILESIYVLVAGGGVPCPSLVPAIGGGGISLEDGSNCGTGGGRSAIRFNVAGDDIATAGGGYVNVEGARHRCIGEWEV